MARFDHERLNVYRVSIRLVADVQQLTIRLPRWCWDVVSQTRRAAISIPLNIAEGSGEFSRNEKVRFFRIARRSATECAAALDVLQTLGVIDEARLRSPRESLDRIVAMLTKMTIKSAGHRPQSVPPAPAHAPAHADLDPRPPTGANAPETRG